MTEEEVVVVVVVAGSFGFRLKENRLTNCSGFGFGDNTGGLGDFMSVKKKAVNVKIVYILSLNLNVRCQKMKYKLNIVYDCSIVKLNLF